MNVKERVTALVDTRFGGLDALHDVVDQDKLVRLVTDLRRRGWCGPPLVAHVELGLTGSHRLAAVSQLWNEHGVQVDVPRVQVAELCAEFAVPWPEVLAEHDDQVYVAASALRDQLPRAVVDYLGYDVDGAL